MLHLGQPPRVRIRGTKEYAGVVELADTYDLGSYVVRHAGSSPVARTICATAFAVARIVFYVRPIVVTLHLILYDSQKIQEWI